MTPSSSHRLRGRTLGRHMGEGQCAAAIRRGGRAKKERRGLTSSSHTAEEEWKQLLAESRLRCEHWLEECRLEAKKREQRERDGRKVYKRGPTPDDDDDDEYMFCGQRGTEQWIRKAVCILTDIPRELISTLTLQELHQNLRNAEPEYRESLLKKVAELSSLSFKESYEKKKGLPVGLSSHFYETTLSYDPQTPCSYHPTNRILSSHRRTSFREEIPSIDLYIHPYSQNSPSLIEHFHIPPYAHEPLFLQHSHSHHLIRPPNDDDITAEESRGKTTLLDPNAPEFLPQQLDHPHSMRKRQLISSHSSGATTTGFNPRAPVFRPQKFNPEAAEFQPRASLSHSLHHQRVLGSSSTRFNPNANTFVPSGCQWEDGEVGPTIRKKKHPSSTTPRSMDNTRKKK